MDYDDKIYNQEIRSFQISEDYSLIATLDHSDAPFKVFKYD